MSVTFVVNSQKPESERVAYNLLETASEKGLSCKIVTQYPLIEGALRGVDLCCSIGGDGTLLGCVAEAVSNDVPLLGINVGKLGFLASIPIEESRRLFDGILAGKFRKVKRQLLACTTTANDTILALNDVVIKQESYTRLIHLKISTKKSFVTEYFADGLIFSTATGSTAYNLSAKGPILHPDLKGYAMTPICPHSLSNRSLVFDAKTELFVDICEPNTRPQIMIDGRPFERGENPCRLTIKMAKKALTLIEPQDYNYFHVLRTKLNWQKEG